MGYETKIMFVNGYGKKNGYQRTEAIIEMGKITWHKSFYEFVEKTKKKTKNTDVDERTMDKIKELHNEIYNGVGNHTIEHEKLDEKEQNKKSDKYYKLRQRMEKKYPFVFEGDEEAYKDNYGDFLIVCSIKELEREIEKVRFEQMNNEDYPDEAWDKYDIAIAMCKGFKSRKLKVVLWGH